MSKHSSVGTTHGDPRMIADALEPDVMEKNISKASAACRLRSWLRLNLFPSCVLLQKFLLSVVEDGLDQDVGEIRQLLDEIRQRVVEWREIQQSKPMLSKQSWPWLESILSPLVSRTLAPHSIALRTCVINFIVSTQKPADMRDCLSGGGDNGRIGRKNVMEWCFTILSKHCYEAQCAAAKLANLVCSAYINTDYEQEIVTSFHINWPLLRSTTETKTTSYMHDAKTVLLENLDNNALKGKIIDLLLLNAFSKDHVPSQYKKMDKAPISVEKFIRFHICLSKYHRNTSATNVDKILLLSHLFKVLDALPEHNPDLAEYNEELEAYGKRVERSKVYGEIGRDFGAYLKVVMDLM
mmetsp:Transcript_27267/g.30361  ORF Transcript_27267/g.30361 Transcript_27267/m.30361 type:complete len:353 (+) Transcript_27267:32-1090(+)